MTQAVVYDISELEHHFGDRVALALNHLQVRRGEIVGIFGPNGAGKSTLLSVLAFMLAPSRGRMRFLGQPAAFCDPALRRQSVLLPQDPALLRRSVEANVAYGLKVRGLRDPARVRKALATVGLDPAAYAARRWWELSGGETRRVALAARLALEPVGLLLDEPSASLDPRSAQMVLEAVRAARDSQGLACVVVSHDDQWLTSLCDTLYRLAPGEGLCRQP